MNHLVKEYGCQRSGTNFLRVILQENYEVTVLTNIGGWKHGYYEVPKRLHREVDCLICVKDPYAWLVSQYNYRHPNKDISFADFIGSPITIIAKRGSNYGQVAADSPIGLWVGMYRHWLELDLLHCKKFVLRYERLLAEPEATLQPVVAALGLRRREPWKFRLRRAFGLAGPTPEFFLPTTHLQAVPNQYGAKDIKHGARFDASRYTKRKYLESFTPQLLDSVNRHLAQDLLDTLGYRRVDASELPVRAA